MYISFVLKFRICTQYLSMKLLCNWSLYRQSFTCSDFCCFAVPLFLLSFSKPFQVKTLSNLLNKMFRIPWKKHINKKSDLPNKIEFTMKTFPSEGIFCDISVYKIHFISSKQILFYLRICDLHSVNNEKIIICEIFKIWVLKILSPYSSLLFASVSRLINIGV